MKNYKFLIVILLFSLKGYTQQYGNWVRSNCYSFIETRIKFEESYPVSNGKFTERNVLVQIKNNSSKRIVLAYHISINKDIKQVYKIVNGNLQTHNINSSYSGSTGVLEIDPHQTITDGMHMINIQDNQTLWIEISCIKEYNNDNKTLKQYYTRCDNGNLCSACQFSSTSSCDDDVNSNHSQNSTGSSGTSSMNRGGNVVTGNSNNTNSEGTGWNGNNGSSNNNNYNQQIQNQNTKTTEAFDLYNSTGNYEEARRKLVEAKNNAPDEASRQVAQQNLDKLDKVENHNQTFKTVATTLNIATDFYKSLQEEKKRERTLNRERAINESNEKINKALTKIEALNKIINDIENRSKKNKIDYEELIQNYKLLLENYKIIEIYGNDDIKTESRKISTEAVNSIMLYRIELSKIGFSTSIYEYILDLKQHPYYYERENELINNYFASIINGLIEYCNKNNSNTKEELNYAYLDIAKFSKYLFFLNINSEDLNVLNDLLMTENKYLEIAYENKLPQALTCKAGYYATGWYKHKIDLKQFKLITEELLKKYSYYDIYSLEKIHKIITDNSLDIKPISKDDTYKITSLFNNKSRNKNLVKKIKEEFDKILISNGYSNKIYNFEKNFSTYYYDGIGDISFENNSIYIVFFNTMAIKLFENFKFDFLFDGTYNSIDEDIEFINYRNISNKKQNFSVSIRSFGIKINDTSDKYRKSIIELFTNTLQE